MTRQLQRHASVSGHVGGAPPGQWLAIGAVQWPMRATADANDPKQATGPSNEWSARRAPWGSAWASLAWASRLWPWWSELSARLWGHRVRGRRRVGVVCTFVSTQNADRVEAQCPATAILPGGQITIQGVIVNRSLNFTLPITGGLGSLSGRRGTSGLARCLHADPAPGRADLPPGGLTASVASGAALRAGPGVVGSHLGCDVAVVGAD
jgi:hypothetical protein